MSKGAKSAAWARECHAVLAELKVSREQGLTSSEAPARQEQVGPNRLRSHKRRSAWLILLEQFKSLIIGLLAAAAGLAFVFGEWMEGTAILAALLVNAGIGFATELRAVRSMEALQRLGSVAAKVRREGSVSEIPAEDLVPGDIVLVEGGDIITADLRVLESSKLQADESALTGESVPVGKSSEPIPDDTPLVDRRNMLFKGTAVTRGSAEAVAVATGMNTELGQISSLVEQAEDTTTPLEKRLDRLGRKLIWATLAIAMLVAASGIVAGKDILLMIETSIALAVAAVPEGLPIVATIALARGLWRMARRSALINRLSAVETLGATTVICTDKTGTLTENKMTVTRIVLAEGEVTVEVQGSGTGAIFRRDGRDVDAESEGTLKEALTVAALCNNASFSSGPESAENEGVGDPLEIALLAVAAQAGLRREDLTERWPEVREEAFDPDVKMMATYHRTNDGFRVAAKGAAESLLEASTRHRLEDESRPLNDADRRQWLDRAETMAREGLRVLAVGTKTADTADAQPYEDLVLIGLMGLMDPPRPGVGESIALCRDAGIRVVMVTGDQPATARAIGDQVGITGSKPAEVVRGDELTELDDMPDETRRRVLKTRVFARVNPAQKLRLIDLYQRDAAVVAMTGDGVNDAPALKKADIGVAMGQRGTQVAREAADMVLKDDSFGSIVRAVEQGRVIFGNIRKFVVYLLSCNVSEIMVVSLASIVNAPLPLLPLQILFLNLLTDVFPALALGVGEGGSDVMKQPPRDPDEPIVGRAHWLAIGGYGLVITLSVLSALALALLWLDLPKEQAVTISFLTLAFAQLWHVFNMRRRGSHFIRNEVTRNAYVWGALALCVGLLLAAIFQPTLAAVLRLHPPGRKGWLLVGALSLVPWAIGQAGRAVMPNRGSERAAT